MYIYNTLSQKKEDLDQILNGKKAIRMFVCGPTVYDYVQLGNARTFASFDIIARYLRSIGYKLFYLQNITDIDDKIIRRAQEQKIKPEHLAAKYAATYLTDMRQLGVRSISRYAPATKYIKKIVKQVQVLIEKGHAYKIENDGWYFDIKTFSDYGKLAKRTIEQAEDAVSRIDDGARKRNRGDFALWKFSPPEAGKQTGEPSWKTELGNGRPGWHIEDTAITEHYFGPQYDLHGGGMDLMFPHHEAEIAQQESASGKKPFVRIWMHAGFLNINKEKMSKSRSGFITLRSFLENHSPAALRYIIASHHYRAPLEYSDNLIKQTENTLANVGQFIGKLKMTRRRVGATGPDLKVFETRFHKKMADDFNTPEALAVLFELINDVNLKMWEIHRKGAAEIAKWLTGKLSLLGIELKLPRIPFKIGRLAIKRELFRSSKQFIKADDLRKEVEALGYTIEDTSTGPFIWPSYDKKIPTETSSAKS